MSSITPASFVDDGSSFEKRILHRPHNNKRLNSSNSDTTSAYTGSYIDDGADMLLPSMQAAGFGTINSKFYKQRKRKENQNTAWNDDVQKAVAGDIKCSLQKMRGVGGLRVKRASDDELDEQGRKRKDTATIPVPRKWGTFVVKDDHGRVIVVDENGEFDSGVQMQQQPVRWVKAPTTMSVPLSSKTERAKRHMEETLLEPIKLLPPISESEYEDGYILSSRDEDILSPTGFFMTGGASGWPSPPQSPSKSGHVPVNSSSPVVSLDGKRSRLSDKSRKSHRLSRKDEDMMSTKTYSTYKPATVEDAPDTSSENASLTNKTRWGGSQRNKQDDWTGSRKGSDVSWGEKRGVEHTWGGSNTRSHRSFNLATNTDPQAFEPPIKHQTPPSVAQNWVSDRVQTVSEASSHRRRHARYRDHSPSQSHISHGYTRSRIPSEATWDGYELPKTMSNVSVAGTDSEMSLPASRRARSHRSHRSTRTEHWGGSEQDWGGSQRANIDGWGGETTASHGGGKGKYSNGYEEGNETYLNDSWGGVKVRVGRSGSEGAGKRYSNGFDEDNETYLNDVWSGVRVRVGSRRG